jgi:outer membrane protein TolC
VKLKILLLSITIATSLSAQIVTLEEAISIALENNKKLKISETSLKIANELYTQALSAHYPTLDFSLSALRLDEAPIFNMRGTTTVDNSQTITLYNGLSTAAAADGNVNLSGAYSNLATNTPTTSNFPIDMDVKIMGRDTVTSKLDIMLPLYTGGKISALTKQAKIGKLIAIEGINRSKNKVIFDVKKYYYGVILAKKLKELTSDILLRMSLIQDLTSELYQGGSLKVKKTDFLRSKMSVNTIKVFYEDIKAKEIMAKTALANVMGYKWSKEIDIVSSELMPPIMNETLKDMIKQAYDYNPDYSTLNLALQVKDAQINESKSGYLPQAALIANTQHIYNDYEYGVINDTNKNSWSIGVAIQWSLFNGMRTNSKVEQSKLEKIKVKDQKILLKDGLAVQIKQVYLEMESSFKKYEILKDTINIAIENRDLNTRAYQHDMVETKDVIESQIFEALTKADYYRSLNNHALALAKAELIIGNAIENAFKK